MTILVFSFLAGLFTVLSPCILPILPVMLAAGVGKGTWRPLGVVLGLVCSFSFFTLALTSLVHATGVSPNLLRYMAIGLIALFGLIMIFPRWSNWFAQALTPIADIGQRLQPKQPSTGFLNGVVLGVALGFLWTPCAGPILATITTLVATHELNAMAIVMTFAYSIGAGIPMFFIAYGGSKIIQASRFLSTHAERIRQFFGCVMIAFSVLLAFRWDVMLNEKLATLVPETVFEQDIVKKQRDITGNAPEIVGIDQWINSKPLPLKDLKGKVVLIDFWTYSCINCLRTLPYLKNWYRDYKNDGFTIIGVHTPEFEFEKDPKHVQEAVDMLGIEYPVALDNEYATWQAYHNHFWPAHFLIDQEGNIRMVHYGEGGYVETENAIRNLLGLTPLQMQEPKQDTRSITPETYLGLLRGRSYPMRISPHKIVEYHYSGKLADDQVGLQGSWLAEDEYILSASDDSVLELNFLATKVYLVLGGSSNKPLVVTLDGRDVGNIQVNGDRKYDIVTTTYGRHYLSIKVPRGIQAYVFTFGSD